MKAVSKILFLGLIFAPLVLIVHGQEKLRTINDGRNNFRDAPITIIGREVGGKTFDGRQDLAGSDWLENLTLTIKNVSSKNIKKVSILLKIPPQRTMPNMAGIYYNFPSGKVRKDENGNLQYEQSKSAILKPGETHKLEVWKPQLQILEVLKQQGVADIADVELSIQTVTFEDGTGWLTGVPAAEDPSRPGSLIIVKPGVTSPRSSWWDSDWLSTFFSVATLAASDCSKSKFELFLMAGLRRGAVGRPLDTGCGYSNGPVRANCTSRGRCLLILTCGDKESRYLFTYKPDTYSLVKYKR